MRHPTLALVALLITSCAPAPTRIALTIEYDDAWEIGLMEIRGNSGEAERDVRLPAQHSLEIWVPDSWAGQEARIRVRGLHGSNDAVATGTGTIIPVLGATTPLTITLHRVACGAWCTEGETRCFGDAVAACAQLDLDPCLEWAPSVPCPPDAPFCSLGQCRAQCIDECAENEMRCDGPSGYQICGNFNGDSCREWSTTTMCGEGQTCDSGTCISGCRNQCTAGATECRGSSIVTCGDLNDDGCTEWGPITRCATGTCEANRCVERCTNECETGECSGNIFHECGQFDDDPCLDRSPGLSCTPADLCLDGMCHPTGCTSIARACDRPPAQTCINTNTLRVYDAVGECTAGDCNYTSRDISCPNCPSCEDPCAGVTCNTPPAATCANSSTRRTFASTGTCEAGSCDYSHTDTPCNNPPAATCANSTTTRTYPSSGTCSSGTCSYSPIDTACNRPPAASCIDGSTLRTYMSAGNCSSGTCIYAPIDTVCPAGCIGNACTATDGTWTALADGGPSARYGHSAIWTGTNCAAGVCRCRAGETCEMIIWGGWSGTSTRDGGRFNPVTDSWSSLDTTNAPSARFKHSAIWTGTEMIIWGGVTAANHGDGGRFNPATNSWSNLDTTDAPSARNDHSAIWTGTEMIIWGGDDGSNLLRDGRRFNPATNTWSNLDTTNAPSARENHSAIWTGTEMIIWGGIDDDRSYLRDGGRFNPTTNTWSTLDTTNVPSARDSHSAIWTGTEMIIWGGSWLRDGGRFNPDTHTWSPLNTTNAPSARRHHTAIWTGTEMIIWGGWNGSNQLRNGGRWRP